MNTTADAQQTATTAELLNAFYTFLSTAGFVPLVVILISIRTLIAGIGIVFNLSLGWVTIRSRNLHGTTNILIAIDSVSLAIYEIGFFPIWIIVLVGKNLVRLEQCFWPMLLPVFAKNFSSALMVAVGLDRLKYAIFPLISSKVQKYFMILWTIPCAIYGLTVILLSYRIMLRMPNSFVMCTASEITQYEAAVVSYNATLILQCLSPIVYCVLGIFVYVKMPTNGQQQSNKSLFKSIVVLMLIQLFGWGSNSLSLLFFRKFFAITSLSDMTKWAMNCVFSYVLTVATTANAPTLYFCNFEYKTAFQAQFRSLFSRSANNNKVAAMQQVKPIGNNNNISAGRTVQRVRLNA